MAKGIRYRMAGHASAGAVRRLRQLSDRRGGGVRADGSRPAVRAVLLIGSAGSAHNSGGWNRGATPALPAIHGRRQRDRLPRSYRARLRLGPGLCVHARPAHRQRIRPQRDQTVRPRRRIGHDPHHRRPSAGPRRHDSHDGGRQHSRSFDPTAVRVHGLGRRGDVRLG